MGDEQAKEDAAPAGVRFTDVNEEIEPAQTSSVEQTTTTSSVDDSKPKDLSPEEQQQMSCVKLSMRKSRLQASRLENFSFEPMSLPGSRASSPARGSRPTSAHSGIPSPPLTPAATQSPRDPKRSFHSSLSGATNRSPSSEAITPQTSPPPDTPTTSRPDSVNDQASTPPTSTSNSVAGTISEKGPPREERPSITPQAQPTTSHAKPSRSGDDVPTVKAHDEKRSSVFAGRKHLEEDKHEKHHLGSMSDLKRFFKLGGHKHKDKSNGRHGSTFSERSSISKSEKSEKPEKPEKKEKVDKSGTQTPPNHHHPSQANIPFADDHGLQSKYGKFGKVLGSGAGGSVRLMKRSSDNTTFAVKQFRARHSYETEKEYNKKVTAEFCIGSTLHHGNIIETMDIIHEKGSWFEVMEYAPYDLFAIVMSGKMSREEISCCTVQVLNAVTYLHSMGLAHRDLKLDNVVVNYAGILKLIDFGSAVVFRYPFEDDIVRARGIVGSDPYLAPEVYDEKYDPRAVDVWSIAIMYCCMILRRFPWKAPRVSDNSFKLFVSPASPGQPTVESLRRATEAQPQSEPTSRGESEGGERHHHHHHRSHEGGSVSEPVSHTDEKPQEAAPSGQQQQIRGPWRLLRLLPRESRLIIGHMLEVDPKNRITMEEVLADKWVASRPVCRQEEGGKIFRAEGHDHVLEPSGTVGGDS